VLLRASSPAPCFALCGLPLTFRLPRVHCYSAADQQRSPGPPGELRELPRVLRLLRHRERGMLLRRSGLSARWDPDLVHRRLRGSPAADAGYLREFPLADWNGSDRGRSRRDLPRGVP
jgi:hypothetical protein